MGRTTCSMFLLFCTLCAFELLCYFLLVSSAVLVIYFLLSPINLPINWEPLTVSILQPLHLAHCSTRCFFANDWWPQLPPTAPPPFKEIQETSSAWPAHLARTSISYWSIMKQADSARKLRGTALWALPSTPTFVNDDALFYTIFLEKRTETQMLCF